MLVLDGQVPNDDRLVDGAIAAFGDRARDAT
jgi:hypothetical protein